MGIKGPMPPNTLRVSNIGEDVSEEDLHRLFSNFGRLECIEFETSTCALVKFINFYHAREALENLQDTKMEGRELTIVWNEVQTPSISSKVWIRIDGPFLDDQELNDLFSVYGFVRQCEFSGRSGKMRGAVSFELDSAADSAVHDLNGTTIYGRKFYVAKFVRNMGDVVAALDHTAAQEPIKFASIYKFEGMELEFVAGIEMDSIRTVADFLLVLHDLWGSPLAVGLSLNCPWPGYHARYYHANSRTYEPVLVEEEGFLSNVEGLKGVQHVVLLSQLSAYRGSGGIQALMKSNARKLAEQDESLLMASGIPYTIIRAGLLQSTPGGQQGFSFEEGSAARGNLSKEDAAFICVQALDAVPQRGFIFEVVNGDEKISDWQECMARLMEKAGQQLQ
ncbi:uncharacterized protein LOC126724935 isoform X5 [Quercus robur]|uniref:uncharacterized protein LOC126724935 isoform X2 n=1 Tax=Quercus robur TaxID=38942 RepID=UPI002162B61F|nr:uncharacterized protein LOC126724935 isoform X2 [Quercus robur]XP_050285312.1 uncharacterized protein LOC126724935 isoform X3 [Quercus robur]XP_050285313.1 uncharacterized protein LOC126724935 isoform X4 [Quercus robur]XP_050285314.1 uncharacterized protein LOC126724935 isoform X5 [Quercus robur]